MVTGPWRRMHGRALYEIDTVDLMQWLLPFKLKIITASLPTEYCRKSLEVMKIGSNPDARQTQSVNLWGDHYAWISWWHFRVFVDHALPGADPSIFNFHSRFQVDHFSEWDCHRQCHSACSIADAVFDTISDDRSLYIQVRRYSYLTGSQSTSGDSIDADLGSFSCSLMGQRPFLC